MRELIAHHDPRFMARPHAGCKQYIASDGFNVYYVDSTENDALIKVGIVDITGIMYNMTLPGRSDNLCSGAEHRAFTVHAIATTNPTERAIPPALQPFWWMI